MPTRVSETYVLRTYPFREADLIVSCLTRDQGKIRGVARRARHPKNAFGSGLERLSLVRMAYYERENAELVSLSGCELIESAFGLQSEYERSLTLDYFTEVSEQLLPLHEANERFFRLLKAMLDYLRADGSIWPAVDYFSLWAVRLSGILPELRFRTEETEMIEEIFQKPIRELTPREWSKATLSPLRRMLIRSMEQHVERKLLTVRLLEAL